MSASVSVALHSVNLFVPCPLHCMFAQDLVSACLDVFGWSYLPVEIRLHVCLFTHACLVIQVLSCSHSVSLRLFAHLCTCPYVSVHVFLFTQINTCTKYLHKVWSVSPCKCAQDTVSVCSCSAYLHVCVFAHLLVCTCIYLTVHASNCVHICLPVSHVMITFCTNLVAAFSKWLFVYPSV